MTSSKRVLSETGSMISKEKRLRPSVSFRSVVVDVMRVKCFQQSLTAALEPLLRRVVGEEVDEAVRRRCRLLALSRSPSLRIQEMESSPRLKLVFAKPPSLPIFTGTKIHDSDANSLRILLVRQDDAGGHALQLEIPSHPLKIELVVIDGDFCSDRASWTTDEFEAKIIKERDGRRPLLAGELLYTLRDGGVAVGDIEFTDNSSWIRSRKFRLAARASNAVGVLQAVSEPFVVRDHRGELYKKHYPPILRDQVWRLEKIGKDGIFHQKLKTHGIKTVQDFLKLSNVNPTALRQILGQGMSDKMWEVTIKHAKTCLTDNKVYMLRAQNHQLALSPFCQVMWANIDATYYTPSQDSTISTKMRVEELVKYAYDNWESLEVVSQLVGPTQMMMDQSYDEALPTEYNNIYNEIITTNVEMDCLYYSPNTSYHDHHNPPPN